MPSLKRTFEEADLEGETSLRNSPPVKIPRVMNCYIVAQSAARYVFTGKLPERKENQVGDVVSFIRGQPRAMALFRRAFKDLPKDIEGNTIQDFNKRFSRVWEKMSDKEKQPFVDYSEWLREEQLRRFPDYVYRPTSPKQKGKPATQAKPKRTRAPATRRVDVPPSPQSTAPSPSAASSSSSPFDSPLLFTPGTTLQPLAGSPAGSVPAVDFEYTYAAASTSKQQYNLNGATLQPPMRVQGSPYAQGSPSIQDMGLMAAAPCLHEPTMLGLYTGYVQQPAPAYNMNAGWDNQLYAAAPPPSYDVGENGSALLGGGLNYLPQVDNDLLNFNLTSTEPYYGSSAQPFDAGLGFDLLGMSLGSSLLDGLPETDFLNYPNWWQVDVSPVWHATAPGL